MKSGGSCRGVRKPCPQPNYVFESYHSDIDFLSSELDIMTKLNKKSLQEIEQLEIEKDDIQMRYDAAMEDNARLIKEIREAMMKESVGHVGKEKEEKMRRVEKEKMMKENARLIEEKEVAMKENARLIKEKEDAMKKNASLIKEMEEVMEENQRVVKEKEEAMKENQRLIKENEWEMKENAMLREENERHRDSKVSMMKQMSKERQVLMRANNIISEAIQERDDAMRRCEEVIREKERVIKEKADAEVRFREAMTENTQDKEEVFNKAMGEIEEQIKEKKAAMRENERLTEENQWLVKERQMLAGWLKIMGQNTKNEEEEKTELEVATREVERLTQEKENAMREVERLMEEKDEVMILYENARRQFEVEIEKGKEASIIKCNEAMKEIEASIIKCNEAMKEIEATKAREIEEIEAEKKVAIRDMGLVKKQFETQALRVLVKETQNKLLIKQVEDAENRFNEVTREKDDIKKANAKEIQALQGRINMLCLEVEKERKAAKQAVANAKIEAAKRAAEVEKRAAAEAERNVMKEEIWTLRELVLAAEDTARREAEFAAAFVEAEYEIVD